MFELANYNRLVALEQDEPQLKKEFAYLLEAKVFISQRKPQRLSSLQVERIDDYTIDVSYVNTTVRFHLLLAYSNGRSCGHVVCLRKCSLFWDAKYDNVGEFGFTLHGVTDLPINQEGETLHMSTHPDIIVMTFLDQAVAEGPAKLENK
jgi:hypothetical protein